MVCALDFVHTQLTAHGALHPVECFKAYCCPLVLMRISNVEMRVFSGALQGVLYAHRAQGSSLLADNPLLLVWAGVHFTQYACMIDRRLGICRCWPCRLLDPVASVGVVHLFFCSILVGHSCCYGESGRASLSTVERCDCGGQCCFCPRHGAAAVPVPVTPCASL